MIEDRNLEAGTVLRVRHKGKEHECRVMQTDDGLRYRLANGKEFNSPSSAGREVTGGVAVNGWRFWSVGDLKPRKAKSEPKPKATAKKASKKSGKKAAKKKSSRAASRDSYGCGACGQTFATMKAATKHALTHTTD